jgi:hypothetical protein
MIRAQKPEEIDLFAGAAGSTITVTGHRTTSTTFTKQLIFGGGGEGGGAGGSGGGVGGGGAAGVLAGTQHTTKEGHVYKANINLTAAQAAIVDQIVDYGKDHGYSDAEIDVAVADAYYESGFNASATNGSHTGLFQYNSTTWASLGEAGSINSATDQIAAIYHDISKYESRYASAMSTNADSIATDGLSFGQYFEIKHELGNNSTSWLATNPITGNRYISDWSSKDNGLGLQITK